MPLTNDPTQGVFENACQEGNYAMRNLLSVAATQRTQQEQNPR